MPGQHAPLHDGQVFSLLYERNHLIVFRYIYGLTGGPREEVEDLTAETFFKAWRARDRFAGTEEAALAWLIAIARNLIIDSYRRKTIEKESIPQDQILESLLVDSRAQTPEARIEQEQQFLVLWDNLQKLDADKREILVLRYLLGWRVARIAEFLGMAENTVSVQIRRTLLHIRNNWPNC